MTRTELFFGVVILFAASSASSARGQVGTPGAYVGTPGPYTVTPDTYVGTSGTYNGTSGAYAGMPAGQVGMPGIQYSTSIAGGDGGQLYAYDRQDPWLHGHFQRVPAYGGFSSFRPYNYRHVLSQTQLATAWGMPHGMPYSQQFWNRYRGSYLHGNPHSQAPPVLDGSTQASMIPGGVPASAAGFPVYSQRPLQNGFAAPQPTAAPQQPVHIYPQR
jgi:hypothetical protein